MTAKTEMEVMQNTQKDLNLEGQLATASSSCKAMTAALKGEMYAIYDDCMVQLCSSEEVVRRLCQETRPGNRLQDKFLLYNDQCRLENNCSLLVHDCSLLVHLS